MARFVAAVLAVVVGPALGSAAIAQNIDGIYTLKGSVCSEPLPKDMTCLELQAQLRLMPGQEPATAIFEIGPGGRLCGPAVFRLEGGTEVFWLKKGVCISP